MAQLLVRDINDATVAALERQAAVRGASLEAHVRSILDQAALDDRAEAILLLRTLRESLHPSPGPDSVAMIREDRDR